jgi:hypothetical protein
MRMEPNSDAAQITVIPRGGQGSARSVTADGLWVLVEYGNLRGWVAGRYLQVVNGSMTDFTGPAGITFTADQNGVMPGTCVNLSWNVQNAALVYYQNEGVASSGTRQECPTSTLTYTLRVVTYGNESIERQVTVTVVGSPPVGEVPAGGGVSPLPGGGTVQFTSTSTNIATGECVTLSWATSGVQAVYYQEQAVEGTGSRQECPTLTTTYTLRLLRTDGQSEFRQITVNVGFSPGGTPGAGAVIAFNSTATNITSGQCVTLTWSVSNIREVYYQERGVTGTGSQEECPTTTTTYTLRVVRTDGVNETRQITIYVN